MNELEKRVDVTSLNDEGRAYLEEHQKAMPMWLDIVGGSFIGKAMSPTVLRTMAARFEARLNEHERYRSGTSFEFCVMKTVPFPLDPKRMQLVEV